MDYETPWLGKEDAMPPKPGKWGDTGTALSTVFVGAVPTAKRLRKARIDVIEGPDAGVSFIVDRERMRFGRSMVNDFSVNDPSVSNVHFELKLTDRGVLLKDMGSTNGTYYGEVRIQEVYLSPGVVFRAGNTKLRFLLLDDAVDVQLSDSDHFGRLTGRSIPMREIFALLEKVAPSDLTVLIEGETGTGKEEVARAIHARSPRASRPFVVLDCSAIPPNLMESTLFGHERGSFTGAVERRLGVFEEAGGGTIFLDEIGELDTSLQPKLLRVLETGEIKRIGGNKVIRSKARVLAATNRDLRQMVADGLFRQDLYFRLSVVRVELPPLRDRPEDIPALLDEFLSSAVSPRFGPGSSFGLTNEALASLLKYPWPGNVRELRNVVERAVAMAESPLLTPRDFFPDGRQRWIFPPGQSHPSTDPILPVANVTPDELNLPFKEAKQRVLERFERAYLEDLMRRHEGNISQGARTSGLTRFHLRELLKKHGIHRS